MNALSMLSSLSSSATSLGATSLGATSLEANRSRSTETDREALQRKAVEFESIYLTQMLQPMFENLGDAAEPFGDGPGQDVWRSMQVEQYGKAIAAGGGIGLAERVARELITAQETYRGYNGQEARNGEPR